MPKQETILNRAEVAHEFGISESIVARFIETGELRAWSHGEGRNRRWEIPMSSAEVALGAFKGALTLAEMIRESGLTEGTIRGACDAGRMRTLRPKGAQRSSLYVARAEFDRWLAQRQKSAKEAPPALKLTPTTTANGTGNGHAPAPRADGLPEALVPAAQKAFERDMARKADLEGLPSKEDILRLTENVEELAMRMAAQGTVAKLEALRAAVNALGEKQERVASSVWGLTKRVEAMEATMGNLAAAIELRLGEPLPPKAENASA